MRIILLLLGILTVFPAMGDVYRSVDEDGNIIFTDKPSPDAEKVEINEVQTIDPGNTPRFNYTPPKKSQDATVYKNITITSPANDETLSANEGNVSVSVSVEPRLFPGHTIVLYLDGSPAGEGSGQFNLTNLDRGTHTLVAAVKDQSGKEFIKSESVSFTVQRHSILHKPSTVGKPPPP